MGTLLLVLTLAATFDVATLKQSPPPGADSYQIILGTIRNGRVEMKNANLADCLKFAYGLVSDDQISGPDWIKSKTVLFDVVAQTSPDTPRPEVLAMMQALLAERLKLRVHYEQKPLRYLALTQAKTGLKMRPVAAGGIHDNSGGNGHVRGSQMSMLLLASLLSRFEHEIVIDNTGLDGFFEVTLDWTPESGRPTVAANDAAPGPSLFTAVQEQLGLRLESRKGPVDVLVVDSAQQVPTEN